MHTLQEPGRRHRFVFALWAIAIAAGVIAAPIVFDTLESSLDPAATSEAEIVEARMIDTTGFSGNIAAIISVDPASPGIEAGVQGAIDEIGRLDGIARVGGGTAARGTSGDNFLITADVEPNLSGDQAEALIGSVRDALEQLAPGQVSMGGSVILDHELGATAESDLVRADLIAIPLVIALTALALGGLRATALPLSIVLAAVSTPLALLLGLAQVTEVSVFAVNVVSMFGVGLAVDYGLLVGSRYREELAAHGDHHAALAATMSTAGRAVTYSGITVAAALSGLLVFRESLLRSLAYGGIGAVLVAVLAARTLLPALLKRFPHLLTPAPEPAATGTLYRISRRVQKTPGLVLVTVTALLVVLSIPVFSLQLEGLDARSLPVDSESRRFVETLSAEYSSIPVAPIALLVDATPDDPLLRDLEDQITELGAVDSVATMPLNSGLTMVDVVAAGPPTGAIALDTVRAIRQIPTQLKVGVTGEAAEEVDLLESMASRLPLALITIGIITLLLLISFTRAPVAAAKALVVNILSVGAAFGILVWIFQSGNLAGPLGFEPIGALEAVILLLTFVFAFGLSMDYEVFLLARIREEYDSTGDNAGAVAVGLQRSGRVVTLAAFLITVLFVGFAMGDLILIKQLGVGLALAVLVDATIVRMLLVPAIMILMGDRNWWAPQWLRRT